MNKVHFNDWEHVYRAHCGTQQLMVEAHEWMEPDWPEGEEPFGSIYYDIYSVASSGNWGVYDGGVVGYEEGAFRTQQEFIDYLNRFMKSCGQGAVIDGPLTKEQEILFYEAY